MKMIRQYLLLAGALLLLEGCMLPHPQEPGEPAAPQAAAAKPAAPAPDSKEAAAIAAALQQVSHSKTDYRLAPADLVELTVYQEPDMNRRVRVNTNGTVSLPLIGTVEIGGKTLLEAQTEIETKLAKFVVNPQVSLFIQEYGNRMVFVMGEVQHPGSYPIPTESRMTVLEAVSTASGFTPVAAQDRVRVLRNVKGVSTDYTINTKDITQQGQKEKDMVLEPNDIVYVPQSFF